MHACRNLCTFFHSLYKGFVLNPHRRRIYAREGGWGPGALPSRGRVRAGAVRSQCSTVRRWFRIRLRCAKPSTEQGAGGEHLRCGATTVVRCDDDGAEYWLPQP